MNKRDFLRTAGAGLAVVLAASPACAGHERRPPPARQETARPLASFPPAQRSPQAQCDSMNAAVRLAASQLPASLAPPPHLLKQMVPSPEFVSWFHHEANFGIGVLRPMVRGGEQPPPWGCGLLVPLYDSASNAPKGWLAGGMLLLADQEWPSRIPLPVLEIGQGEAGLIVLEARADGWLRFRYSPPYGRLVGDGTAWTRADRLALGPVHLRLVRWEDFLGHETPPLVFRDGARHPLFSAPDSTGAPTAWMSGSYGLAPLEFLGDWMRVRVESPSTWCSGRGPSTKTEGWIRWRDQARGPLVWVVAWDC